MAYLASTDQVVLFGGWSDSEGKFLNETWALQSNCWALSQTTTEPSPRMGMAMTYDPIRNVVFGFGGRTDPSLPVYSSETWLWDGQSWKQAASGPQLADSRATFDENLQQVVLFGNSADGGSQTWSWDGVKWHQLPVQSPPARLGSGMAYDASSHRVILFGGLELQDMSLVNDTWSWSGSAWSKLAPAHSPTPRQAFAISAYTAQHEIVLIGGNGAGKLQSDGWVWNGIDWSQIAGIGPRRDATAADTGSGVLVFGGADETSGRNDVEIWNGTAWAVS